MIPRPEWNWISNKQDMYRSDYFTSLNFSIPSNFYRSEFVDTFGFSTGLIFLISLIFWYFSRFDTSEIFDTSDFLIPLNFYMPEFFDTSLNLKCSYRIYALRLPFIFTAIILKVPLIFDRFIIFQQRVILFKPP